MQVTKLHQLWAEEGGEGEEGRRAGAVIIHTYMRLQKRRKKPNLLFAGPEGMQVLEEEILASQFVLVVCAELGTTGRGQQLLQRHASRPNHLHTAAKK